MPAASGDVAATCSRHRHHRRHRCHRPPAHRCRTGWWTRRRRRRSSHRHRRRRSRDRCPRRRCRPCGRSRRCRSWRGQPRSCHRRRARQSVATLAATDGVAHGRVLAVDAVGAGRHASASGQTAVAAEARAQRVTATAAAAAAGHDHLGAGEARRAARPATAAGAGCGPRAGDDSAVTAAVDSTRSRDAGDGRLLAAAADGAGVGHARDDGVRRDDPGAAAVGVGGADAATHHVVAARLDRARWPGTAQTPPGTVPTNAPGAVKDSGPGTLAGLSRGRGPQQGDRRETDAERRSEGEKRALAACACGACVRSFDVWRTRRPGTTAPDACSSQGAGGTSGRVTGRVV